MPMKPFPTPNTPGNQSEKNHNLPNPILLLLLIIESLSYYREELKLIETEHAVLTDFCPAHSESTEHLGTHQDVSLSLRRLAGKD